MGQLYAIIAEIQQEAQQEETAIKELRSKVGMVAALTEQRKSTLRAIQEENEQLTELLVARKASTVRDEHVLLSLYLDRLVQNKAALESMQSTLLFSEDSSPPPLSSLPWQTLTAAQCDALATLGNDARQLEQDLSRLLEATPKVFAAVANMQRSQHATPSRAVLHATTSSSPLQLRIPATTMPTTGSAPPTILPSAGDSSTLPKRHRDDSDASLDCDPSTTPAVLMVAPKSSHFRVRFDSNIGASSDPRLSLHPRQAETSVPLRQENGRPRKTLFRPSG